jgi:hypothetical protein
MVAAVRVFPILVNVAEAAETRIPRRLIEAAACALAAHALLYRTLLPEDGMHGYFTWYEPAVAVGSAVAVAWLLFALLRAARSRASNIYDAPFAPTFGRLFASTLLFLLVQESVEGIASSGHLAAAALTPAGVLALAAAAGVVALALAAARCLGRAAVRALLRMRTPRVAHAAQRWQVVLASSLRPRPLAERYGLRAPPFAV